MPIELHQINYFMLLYYPTEIHFNTMNSFGVMGCGHSPPPTTTPHPPPFSPGPGTQKKPGPDWAKILYFALIVLGPDENFLPFLGQNMTSTILKSALKCSRKIMITVLNEQLKGLFSNSKTQEKPSSMKTRLTK